MLYDLPSHDILYDALLKRSTDYEGRAYAGITSTKIFCRLSCGARKPKPENCEFYATAGECLTHGFRPCKRCHPLSSIEAMEPAIPPLLEALDADPEKMWSEQDIRQLGIDPSTARRAFKRFFGVTFLDMARQRRLQLGFQALADQKPVIEAQLDAGFDSPSGFREAFARFIGVSPGKLLQNAMLSAAMIDTPLGTMIAISDDQSLHLLEFMDRKALSSEIQKLYKMVKGDLGIGETAITSKIRTELDHYFKGQSCRFETPLTLHGTPFLRQVWQELQNIPAGTTTSYGKLAKTIDNPKAVRAVARANGTNQLALIIPCHRVIGADGTLTGYAGGLWRKQWLINHERTYFLTAKRPHLHVATR